MAYQKITFSESHGGAVWRILLNAPPGNVLDSAMFGEISRALDELRSSRDAKLLVFEGAGKHFSFGASVEEHTADKAAAMLEQFNALFFKLADLGIPTLAKVRGQCLGGAMELACYCNLVLCDVTARFGQPEIKLGVFPPPASVMLPLRLGQGRADELVLTGRSLIPEEAVLYGVATKAVSGDLDAATDTYVSEHFLPLSASSLRLANKAVRRDFNARLRSELPRLTADYLGELMRTHDAQEGIASFMQKRKPSWKNQ